MSDDVVKLADLGSCKGNDLNNWRLYEPTSIHRIYLDTLVPRTLVLDDRWLLQRKDGYLGFRMCVVRTDQEGASIPRTRRTRPSTPDPPRLRHPSTVDTRPVQKPCNPYGIQLPTQEGGWVAKATTSQYSIRCSRFIRKAFGVWR